jgi:tripartite-type tricarboxylate transporter receptor subunit TctC
MKIRNIAKALAIALLGLTASAPGWAQAFPTKQVTIIVPYDPGATDQLARTLAGSMEKALGKPVVVETRPGAGGSVGAAYVAKSAAPDGHTILFAVSSVQTVAPHQNPLPYGFDDLVPLARVTTGPNVVAARAGWCRTSPRGLRGVRPPRPPPRWRRRSRRLLHRPNSSSSAGRR